MRLVSVLSLILSIVALSPGAWASELHWWPIKYGSLENTFSTSNPLQYGGGTTFAINRCGLRESSLELPGDSNSYITPSNGGTLWQEETSASPSTVSKFWINVFHKGLASSPAPSAIETLVSISNITSSEFMSISLRPGLQQISFSLSGVSVSTAISSYTHGTWNYFGFVRNGGTLEIWINGVKAAASTTTAGSFPSLNFPSDHLNFVLGQQLANPTLSQLGGGTGFISGQGSHCQLSNIRIGINEALTSESDWKRIQQNSATCVQETVSDRPIVHYKLQKDVFDIANVGNGLDTITGASTAIPGSDGQMCWPDSSLWYTGTTASYTNLQSGSMLSGMQDFSYSIWLKESVDLAGQTGCITSIGTASTHLDEFLVCVTTAQSLLVLLNGVTLFNSPTPGEIAIGSRYHLVITRIGNLIKLYLNGAYKYTYTATASSSSAITSPIGPVGGTGWWLGNRLGSASLSIAGFTTQYAFRGYLNDLKVYSFGLDADGVNKLFSIECQHLTHWWDFKDNGNLLDQGVQGWLTGSPATMTAEDAPLADDHCSGSQNSRYLKGTLTSYLAINGSSFHDRIDDYTIAMWFKFDSFSSGNSALLSISDKHHTNGLLVYAKSTDGLIRVYKRSLLFMTSTTAIAAGTWYHIAITKNGGVHRLYLNGVLDAEDIRLGSNPVSEVPPNGIFIGHDQDSVPGTSGFSSSDAFQGWIRDIRFYNSGLDSDTLMLGFKNLYTCPVIEERVLWFDFHRSENLYDRSGHGVEATKSSGLGLSTVRGACLDKSLFWDGGNTDYVDCGTSATFLQSMDDFSISFWIREQDHPTTSTGHAIFATGSSSAIADTTIWLDRTQGKLVFLTERLFGAYQERLYSSAFFITYKHYHISIVRKGLEVRFYVNGELDTLHNVGIQLPTGVMDNNLCYFGQDPDSAVNPTSDFVSTQAFRGYLQDFRVDRVAFSLDQVRGIMKMCSGDPIAHYPLSSGKADDHAVATPYHHPGTLYGDVTSTADSCDQPHQALKWPNSNSVDMIRLNSASFLTGLTDFSIALWVKVDLSYQRGFISIASTTTTNEFYFMVRSDGALWYVVQNTGNKVGPAGSVPANTWTHVGFTRTQNVWRVYANGIEVDSDTKSIGGGGSLPFRHIFGNGTLFGQEQDGDSGKPWTGAGQAGTAQYFKGSMRDVRIWGYSLDEKPGGFFANGFKAASQCSTFTKTVTPDETDSSVPTVSETDESVTKTVREPPTLSKLITPSRPLATPNPPLGGDSSNSSDSSDSSSPLGGPTPPGGGEEGEGGNTGEEGGNGPGGPEEGQAPGTSLVSFGSSSTPLSLASNSNGGNGVATQSPGGEDGLDSALLGGSSVDPNLGARDGALGEEATTSETSSSSVFPWWAALILVLCLIAIAAICVLGYRKYKEARKRAKQEEREQRAADAKAREGWLAELEAMNQSNKKKSKQHDGNNDGDGFSQLAVSGRGGGGLLTASGINIDMEASRMTNDPHSPVVQIGEAEEEKSYHHRGVVRGSFKSTNFKSAPLRFVDAEDNDEKTEEDSPETSSSAADTDAIPGVAASPLIPPVEHRTDNSNGTSSGSRGGPPTVNNNPNSSISSSCTQHSCMVLGDYKKGRLLGSGGFGRVYKGMDLRSGGFVAAKEISTVSLHQSKDEMEEGNRKLKREITLLASLEHPNIVKYLGSDHDHENVYIFMEFLSGGSVRAVIDEYGGQLSPQVTASYIRQALTGLIYLHQNGIVHRDIKAANLILDSEGKLKLADFGCSDMADTMNSMKGTPYWMAPEAIRGESDLMGPASDIWSLGCVAMEMLSGACPFSWIGNDSHQQINNKQKKGGDVKGDIKSKLSSPFQVMHIISNGGPALGKAFNNMPAEVADTPAAADFIRTCCQFDPADRPSATELLEHPFLLH